MKLAFGSAVFIWLLCGAIGAFMLDDLDARHWDKIGRGPLTLIEGINENPLTVPTMG
jgi:hypothetical protein